MRKNRFWIILMTVLLLGVTDLGLWLNAGGDRTLIAEIEVGGTVERIPCWKVGYRQTAYFFLPSYADPESVRLRIPGGGEFSIGDIPVTDGMSCGVFEPDVTYPLTVPGNSDLQADQLKFVQSAGVGTLFLETRTGSMHYLHGNKDHKERGTLRLYDEAGNLWYGGELESISGRGQSTWKNEKKSYNITLSRETDLLGMGKAANWALVSNSADLSNLRNKMVYDYAARAGIAYTPECRWVDLYLNGEYAGLYLLCEKIEIHPQRVAIQAENSFLVSQDALWRFESAGERYLLTRNETALGIRYSDLPMDRLEELWQSVENAVTADTGIDPVTGKDYRELIDVDSWVRKHLLEEVFGNVDAMSLSQYYYLDGRRSDGRICAGPPWDYDLTLNGAKNRIYAALPERYGSSWFPALYEKDEYYQSLRQTYITTFRPLLAELVEGKAEEYIREIRQAGAMNALRWEIWDQEALYDQLLKALRERMAFLDRLWIDEEAFVTVRVFGYDGSYSLYALEPGSVLPPLPDVPEGIISQGWYYTGTEEAADPGRPIYADTSVTLRYCVGSTPTASEETGLPIRTALPLVGLLCLGAGLLAADTGRRTGKKKRSNTWVTSD